MNKNWPRWIFASVCKHFDDNRQGLSMYVEGQKKETVRGQSTGFELRIDGPYITELSKDYWRLFTEVNVLVKAVVGTSSFHQIHTDVGTVAAIFTSIRVYKYGSGAQDDDSFLGCMQLISDDRGKERIQISHFGQINPSVPLLQATVEGHYELLLTT